MPHAVVFPGQGAAVPGAGRPWTEHPSWAVVGEAEAATGTDWARLLLDAPAEELASTRASQLAVLLMSIVIWDALATRCDATPVAFAGHSLGQVTALLAAGAIDRGDGFVLAGVRAERSQESADRARGRMAVLHGATPELADELCADVDGAWVANDNAPGQVVVAGTPAGVEAVTAAAPSVGIRRVLPLDVGHAFHTPLVADAAAALRPRLDAIAWRQPNAPIVTNTDAAAHSDPDGWPALLEQHLVSPVRWRESQLTLADLGATSFVEVGPGSVLAGLARRTVPHVTVVGVQTPDDLDAAADMLTEPVGARS